MFWVLLLNLVADAVWYVAGPKVQIQDCCNVPYSVQGGECGCH